MASDLLVATTGVRIGGSILSGGRWNADIGVAWASVLGLLTLGGVAWLSLRRGSAAAERRMLGLAFAGLLTIALWRCRHVLPSLFHGAGSRYFFPLQTIALWLVMAAMPPLRTWRAGVAWSLVAMIGLLNAPRWREPAFQDLNWPEFAARIRRGEQVVVRINPDWEFSVPGTIPAGAPAKAEAAAHSTFTNISLRCRITREKPAMAGFALRSGTTKTFLVRVVGPSLASFGVSPTVKQPRVALLREGREDPSFRPCDNGNADPVLRQIGERCRAFALEPGAGDLVGLVELASGVYSLVVSTDEEIGGEALLEIYEVPRDAIAPVSASAG